MALVTAEVVPSTHGRTHLAALRQNFVDLGFDVGPAGPSSFSISGSRHLFERTFTDIDFGKPLPVQFSLACLPSPLQRLVANVVSSSNYGPFAP